MKKLQVLISLAVAAGAACSAAESPRFQLFGGYSVDFSRVPASGLSVYRGWNASAAYRIGSRFSLATDVSGHYGRENEVVDVRIHRIAFGPRFTLREGRIEPFVEALVGVSRLHAGSGGPGLSRNTLAVLAGGGTDVRITRRWSLRLQYDYVRQRFFNEQPHGGRLSAGLVFEFGSIIK
jgi:opacity protein-like surface antigen